MSALYSVDTSALIDGLERYYPEETFPAFWGKVEGLISEGRLFISEEVWDESRKKDLAVKTWCDRIGKATLVIPTDSGVATMVQTILTAYPRITMQMKGRNRADPFVVAVASLKNAIAVTGEGADGTADKPKIPYVCNELGLGCIRLLDIARREKWSF